MRRYNEMETSIQIRNVLILIILGLRGKIIDANKNTPQAFIATSYKHEKVKK